MKSNSKRPAPSPLTIYRPGDGELRATQVIENPQYAPKLDGYTGELEVYKYRLVAVQETGEEMFAGYAKNYIDGTLKKSSWMFAHPEHRDVYIERI